MLRKTVSGIILTLLLVGMLSFAFNIQPVRASGTIYIRADGSIDPSDAAISSDNATYTFINDINDSLVVERGHIIIDGAGHRLRGTGAFSRVLWAPPPAGIDVSGVDNVTIKNVDIESFETGVLFSSTCHSVLSGNNIADNYYGVSLDSSFNTTVFGNTITANKVYGVLLFSCSNSTISGNNITSNCNGIIIINSSANMVSDNDLIDNFFGIRPDSDVSFFVVDINNDNNPEKGVPEAGYPNPVYPNPCGSAAFRHALWHTMDRDYVVANMWNGSGHPFYTPASFSMPEFSHPEIAPGGALEHLVHPYNLTEATNILNDAGFLDTDGDGWRNFPTAIGGDGKNIILKYYILESSVPRRDMGLWHADQIEAIGVKVERLVRDMWTCVEEVGEKKDFHLFTGGWCMFFGLEYLLLYYPSEDFSFHPGLSTNYDRVNCSTYTYWVDEAMKAKTFEIARNATMKAQEAFNSPDCVGAISVVALASPLGAYNNTVTRNTIVNNYLGIYLRESSQNKFYHNFVTNASIFEGWNTWDEGYPSGGNYWSDYADVDLYSGPYQNKTGSDGVWDHPYIIDAYIQDRYPLTKPYGGSYDIGITNITTSKTVVGQGYSISITIKILNYGVNAETLNISAYANTTLIGQIQITLSSRNSTTVAFTRNTTGFVKYQNYTIKANVHPVQGEIDIGDNELVDGEVLISIVGDIAGSEGFPDRKVDMRDIGTAAQAFGSYPGHIRWNPIADINNDKKVDMKDIGIVAKEFGKTV